MPVAPPSVLASGSELGSASAAAPLAEGGVVVAADGGGPVAVSGVPPSVLGSAAEAPCAIGDAVRLMNSCAERRGFEVRFVERLEDPSLGLWTVEARAQGVSARGSGVGKKEAKRAACNELLRALGEVAQGRA